MSESLTTNKNEELLNKLRCDNKDYIHRQHRILDKFYKEFFSWSCLNIGYWIMSGIGVMIQTIFMFVPYQEICKDGFDRTVIFYVAMSASTAVFMYIMPYTRFKDKGELGTIYNKIKNLPISASVLRSYRLKKVISFTLKLFCISFVGQMFTSLIFFQEITMNNILYPVVCGLVIPLGIAVGNLYLTK